MPSVVVTGDKQGTVLWWWAECPYCGCQYSDWVGYDIAMGGYTVSCKNCGKDVLERDFNKLLSQTTIFDYKT